MKLLIGSLALALGLSSLAQADYDACVEKAIQKAKVSPMKITDFKAGYQVIVDVNKTFDRKKARDILFLYYTYKAEISFPNMPVSSEVEMVGSDVYFADTCESILGGGQSVSEI